MTDIPKYMKAINTVKIYHSRHDRNRTCRDKRIDNVWYIRPKKIGIKINGVCTVCGETVEQYYTHK